MKSVIQIIIFIIIVMSIAMIMILLSVYGHDPDPLNKKAAILGTVLFSILTLVLGYIKNSIKRRGL